MLDGDDAIVSDDDFGEEEEEREGTVGGCWVDGNADEDLGDDKKEREGAVGGGWEAVTVRFDRKCMLAHRK